MDTEFTGLHQNTTLISIALVAEDNRAFYGEFTDYDKSQLNDWLKEHVIANLGPNITGYDPLEVLYVEDDTPEIVKSIKDWLAPYDKVIMVSDCLAYDWVLFCQLFGGAFSIPENIYYIPIDLSSLLYAAGLDPDISREELAGRSSKDAKHNALWDAIMIKECYENILPKLVGRHISNAVTRSFVGGEDK